MNTPYPVCTLSVPCPQRTGGAMGGAGVGGEIVGGSPGQAAALDSKEGVEAALSVMQQRGNVRALVAYLEETVLLIMY